MTAREVYEASEALADARHPDADDVYRKAGILAQIEAAEALTKIATRLESIDSTLDALRMYGLHVETGT